MNRKFEFSTLLGIILAFALVSVAILSGNSDPSAFADMKSILIVFGGTFFLTSACFSLSDAARAVIIVGQTFFFNRVDFGKISKDLLKISDIVRKKGILELQNHKRLFPNNSFFKKYINLAIDGIKQDEIYSLMQNEIASIDKRHERTIDVLRKGAEIAPAMGLIGTLIGLVQMLGNLDDPTKIGPAMAIALLTTLYGAVFAYMVLLPLATKLERNSEKEIEVLEFFTDSINIISRNQGPVKLEMKLNSYLRTEDRLSVYS
jgi:chemotaxis protein MotA